MNYYNKIYREFVSQGLDFQEAFDIIRRNSDGRAWLIGGAVYRNLTHLLYGTRKVHCDFDFIIRNPDRRIVLPEGWEEKRNRYGNPKFVGDNKEIDFVPLSTVYSIIRRGLRLTFSNYLTGTPLTVQSVGYNISTHDLEGEIGINAIRTRTVSVNNPEQAKIYERKKGKPIEEIIMEKADSLGFTAVL